VRVVLQRVARAEVRVEGRSVGSIGRGLLILAGIAEGDEEAAVRRMARKCAECRIFPDAEGHMNASALEAGGAALVVSQFTLLADVRRGRRPSFIAAARPEIAEPLLAAFVHELRQTGLRVETGVFGAHMDVELVNDGPVTIVIDSADLERARRG